MAKQGMKRPEFELRKNKVPPVPQLGGMGNDLAVENLMDEFDMTAADLQDLQP